MSAYALLLIVLVLLILFLLSAFFSGSETVLFSLSPIQIQRIRTHDASTGALLEKLLSSPGLVFATLLIGNTLTNFAIAGLAYLLFDTLIPGKGAMVSIPLITLLLLLFGEVSPKRIAIVYAERLAPFCAHAMYFWVRLLKPFNVMFDSSSKALGDLLRRERRALSNDELLTMVEMGEEQGVLHQAEASMVEGIMRLSDLMASDEMTPRVDIIGVDLDTSLEHQLESIRTSQYRYLPVYVRTLDTVEGFIDTIRFQLNPEQSIRDAIMVALFVPENVTLDDLLVTFQNTGKYIACVLDEFGGTAGLITRGDILDLVTSEVGGSAGQLSDEIRHLHDETWLVKGATSLDEINHQLDLELEADDADRLAGWITFHAGALPAPGQVVEAQGCRMTVKNMRKRRISLVQLEVVERKQPEFDELDFDDDETIEEEHEGLGQL